VKLKQENCNKANSYLLAAKKVDVLQEISAPQNGAAGDLNSEGHSWKREKK